MYSTDAQVTERMIKQHPMVRVAEARDRTRQRLDVALAGTCFPAAPAPGQWTAFELRRQLSVTEYYTLGRAATEVVASF